MKPPGPRRPLPRLRRAVPAALAVTLLLTLVAACGGGGPPSQASQLRGHLLSVADLPAGWSATPVTPGAVQASDPCLPPPPRDQQNQLNLFSHPASPGATYGAVAFVQGTSVPTLTEVLLAGPQAKSQVDTLGRALADCHTVSLVIAGHKTTAVIHPVSFPQVTTGSRAYQWTFTLAGVPIGVTFVIFYSGPYAGYLSYGDLDAPPTGTVRAFAAAAVAKADLGSTPRVSAEVSVTSQPTLTATTPLGTVGYRAIGSGPPLLLIMGYAGRMERWDRRFVDALAQRYHVVIFDNAGIGKTSPLPGPLSIDAMANQASALVKALGLTQPAVLGWSMGSMIAEALAVLHPGQVSRLVLCAAYPGDGTAVRPSRQVLDTFESGDQAKALTELFPPGKPAARSAQSSYLAAVSGYPPAPEAPAGVVAAQGRAVDDWWAGTDPAGRRAATIAVPTLIADGAVDRLDPVANSRAVAATIRGARLTLFPDAGHAFLFQDQAAFLAQVESFLL